MVPAGTWITVRVDEPISSDRNQAGDVFMATLAQPLVTDGRVLRGADRRSRAAIVEVQKAGYVKVLRGSVSS